MTVNEAVCGVWIMGITELLIMTSTIGQQTGNSLSAWHLIINAGPMVKFVILVLVIFSVIGWAIIGFKFWQLTKANKESKLSLNHFGRARAWTRLQSRQNAFRQRRFLMFSGPDWLNWIRSEKAVKRR